MVYIYIYIFIDIIIYIYSYICDYIYVCVTVYTNIQLYHVSPETGWNPWHPFTSVSKASAAAPTGAEETSRDGGGVVAPAAPWAPLDAWRCFVR